MTGTEITTGVLIAAMITVAVMAPPPVIEHDAGPPPPHVDSVVTIAAKADKLVPETHVVRTIAMSKMVLFDEAFPAASIFYRAPDMPAPSPKTAVAAPEPDPPPVKDICERHDGRKVWLAGGKRWRCVRTKDRR